VKRKWDEQEKKKRKGESIICLNVYVLFELISLIGNKGRKKSLKVVNCIIFG
jgi:hypothetical protein